MGQYVKDQYTIQYNTINFIEHQNRAITARTMLQIPQV